MTLLDAEWSKDESRTCRNCNRSQTSVMLNEKGTRNEELCQMHDSH